MNRESVDENKHSENMNVIKAQATKRFPHPQLFCLYKEVHLKCAKQINSHSVLFLFRHSSPRNTSAAFTGVCTDRHDSQ